MDLSVFAGINWPGGRGLVTLCYCSISRPTGKLCPDSMKYASHDRASFERLFRWKESVGVDNSIDAFARFRRSKRVTFNRWWLISKLVKGYEGSLVRSKHHIHVSYFDILRRRDRRKVGKKWRNVRRSFEVVTEKSPFSSQTQIITVSSIKLKIYHYV